MQLKLLFYLGLLIVILEELQFLEDGELLKQLWHVAYMQFCHQLKLLVVQYQILILPALKSKFPQSADIENM